MATLAHRHARYMGASGERNILCGDVVAHAKPRNHAAAAAIPIFYPSALGMVNATTAVLTGEESATFWIALLLAYDVVFTAACLLFFELVLEAE